MQKDTRTPVQKEVQKDTHFEKGAKGHPLSGVQKDTHLAVQKEAVQKNTHFDSHFDCVVTNGAKNGAKRYPL